MFQFSSNISLFKTDFLASCICSLTVEKKSEHTAFPSPVILLPAHPASFAHKFLFQRVPASPGMQ